MVQLVVHCGVSSLANCITLETRAVCHKNLYLKRDISGQIPNVSTSDDFISNNLVEDKSEQNHCFQCYESQINLQKVCHQVNQEFQSGSIKMPAVISSNAGRFDIN